MCTLIAEEMWPFYHQSPCTHSKAARHEWSMATPPASGQKRKANGESPVKVQFRSSAEGVSKHPSGRMAGAKE